MSIREHTKRKQKDTHKSPAKKVKAHHDEKEDEDEGVIDVRIPFTVEDEDSEDSAAGVPPEEAVTEFKPMGTISYCTIIDGGALVNCPTTGTIQGPGVVGLETAGVFI